MKKILLLSFSIAVLFSFSQKNNCYKYNWDTEPTPDTSVYDTSSHAIYLTKRIIQELVYEDEDLVEYRLTHKRIKLLTDKAIENFNTVYIPQYYGGDNIIEKARVIKSDGTIIKLNSDNIKEGKDEESGTEYRYFAFEGVDVGSEIEYLYLIKKSPYYKGSYFTVQSKYPIFNFKYDFYAPSNLIFKFKSYNGLPDIELDTAYKDANHWQVKLDTIPELKEERFSNYDNDLMAYGYKLDKNYYTGANDIIAYGPWAKDVYEVVYNIEKKQKSAIKKFIKEINPDKTSEEKTIRSVEDYLKKNYAYYNSSLPELSSLPDIYKNKAYNRDGAVILFANIFKELGIKHEIVCTNNRWDLRFDKDFESYAYLDYFMLYFPNIDRIMAITNSYSRLGFPPANYVNCYGLFIKEVSMGDFASGIGKVKFIEPVEMDKSNNKIKVEVNFKDDFEKAELNTTQELTGYNAMYIQPVFELIEDEKKLEDFKKERVNIFDIDEEAETYEIINDKGTDFGIKPLIIKSKFITEKLTEKAGNKYLFKVGQLIGPQMELYKSEEERKENIEFMYQRKYERELIIEIPDGYTVNNLDELNFDKKYTNKEGKTVFGFTSNYKLEGNKIIVEMEEWYDGLNYDKTVWDNYREVVNAAANFNKINLLFKPKE